MRTFARNSIWLLLAALVGGFVTSAMAQEPARMLEGQVPQFLISRDEVQQHLKLSNEQKRKVNEGVETAIQEFMEFAQKMESVAPDERPKQFGPHMMKTREKLAGFLKETLTEPQFKRM